MKQPVERRLAAILAADVAGYSRQMGEDEEGTHERLAAHLRDLVEPKIAEHHGRIVKSTGDGFLADFSSVVDAVRGAMDMQRGMAERNASVAATERIEFRIGINVGDVIVEEHDIFGDGVNVAARLEGWRRRAAFASRARSATISATGFLTADRALGRGAFRLGYLRVAAARRAGTGLSGRHPRQFRRPQGKARREPSGRLAVRRLWRPVLRAYSRGVKIIGATLTSFGNETYMANAWNPQREEVRLAVNGWIRDGGAFDAVADFDQALRDPEHPTQMLPIYDCGDGLHPSDLGYNKMGDAIDLSLFE